MFIKPKHTLKYLKISSDKEKLSHYLTAEL